MALENRKEIIKKIEQAIKARILTLITGDRQGMETRIAPDILSLVTEHISQIGFQDELALFIYTPGGDTIAGWGLVNLLRQYCKKLKVLIPFRSLSCGTLISLGADEIVMGKHGLLSPVDPSVASPFNPTAPTGPQPGQLSLLPVSVEDMIGFLDLARKELNLKDESSLVQILKILSDKVHPLALGAVYRAREQTSTLAKRLLSIHTQDEPTVDKIVKLLTQELPTHNYLIGRSEAQGIGLNITEPDNNVETLMLNLYKEYEDWLKIARPVSPELDLGTDENKTIRYERAAVESLDGSVLLQHIFVTDKHLWRTKTTHPNSNQPVDQILERIIYQGWVTERDGR